MAQQRAPRRTTSDQIEQALLREGIPVIVEDDGTTLRLEGRVDTAAAKMAAADVAAALAPDRRLENNLEVEAVWPPDASADEALQPGAPNLPRSADEIVAGGASLDPDFTLQELETSPVEMAGAASATFDPMPDGETVFFPPTDPVLAEDEQGEPRVVGGFAPTAIDDEEDDGALTHHGPPGDDLIAERVRHALRRDAMTADLAITVAVSDGVVYLTGTVPTLDDAVSAEEVAGRARGVIEVVEALEVAAL
jgi:osmotically-inducible protein OsmY